MYGDDSGVVKVILIILIISTFDYNSISFQCHSILCVHWQFPSCDCGLQSTQTRWTATKKDLGSHNAPSTVPFVVIEQWQSVCIQLEIPSDLLLALCSSVHHFSLFLFLFLLMSLTISLSLSLSVDILFFIHDFSVCMYLFSGITAFFSFWNMSSYHQLELMRQYESKTLLIFVHVTMITR